MQTIIWSSEMVGKIISMRGDDISWREVGAEIGVSKAAARIYGIHILNLPTGFRGKPAVKRAIAPPPPAQRIPAERRPLTTYEFAVALGRPDQPWSLPAGSALSWNLLTAGTCLAGTPYPQTERS